MGDFYIQLIIQIIVILGAIFLTTYDSQSSYSISSMEDFNRQVSDKIDKTKEEIKLFLKSYFDKVKDQRNAVIPFELKFEKLAKEYLKK